MTTVAPGLGNDERVVLLDEQGHDVGTALKAEVHTAATPLHLAFSCYLFDAGGGLLLTRRALHKRTFPGVWTNSVCGHPLPGEPLEQSIRRRGRDELGVEIADLRLVLPRFRYRAEMDGLQEHEWCPVAVGTLPADARPRLDPDEVADARTTPWTDLVARATTDTLLSPWCREQIPQLAALGGSWTDWPAADPADLPPAAHWS